MRARTSAPLALRLSALLGVSTALLPTAVEARQALTVDHFVPVVSRVPSMEGEIAQIYVRERVLPGTGLRDRALGDRVVLFVHGAGTPAEVAFDPPGASWMAYLAEAGYDVFAMDMTGYGRSTRPLVMNDPCNVPQSQQADFVPALMPDRCAPGHGFSTTTIESDWHDLDAVVDYIRELRGVEVVHLFGWSLGGPRAGGYAARHPGKVASVVLLAPAYSRTRPSERPDEVPAPGAAMSKQSYADFERNWDRQLACEGQLDPAVRASVWSEMLASDPVGATWGPGVRRAPRVTVWGWGADVVRRQDTPMLLIAALTDAQVSPERVVELYEDLGSPKKVLARLPCASHNAMWETNRDLLFRASLEWLRGGSVGGVENGEVMLSR